MLSSKFIPQNDYETAKENIQTKEAGVSALHSGHSMRLTFNLGPTLQTDDIEDKNENVEESEMYPNNTSEKLKKIKSLKFHDFANSNLNQSQSEHNMTIPMHFEPVYNTYLFPNYLYFYLDLIYLVTYSYFNLI